jgi:hypothetical protein
MIRGFGAADGSRSSAVAGSSTFGVNARTAAGGLAVILQGPVISAAVYQIESP